jgi:hypothetical protein
MAMTSLLFGLLALGLGLVVLKWAANAPTPVLAWWVRIGGGVTALALAAVLSMRGLGLFAMLPAAAGSWLLSGARVPRWLGGEPHDPTAGARSRVRTEHLEMELDLDTGLIRGRVIGGVFTGRSIETMAPAEIAILWRDCQFSDPRSATILAAYLDRIHPTWREDMARAEAQPGPGGVMTETEALEILGLVAGASEDEIRRAHRELILRMHPDRGGSTYLTAKINEAKDVLLKRR